MLAVVVAVAQPVPLVAGAAVAEGRAHTMEVQHREMEPQILVVAEEEQTAEVQKEYRVAMAAQESLLSAIRRPNQLLTPAGVP
jgi:hypothetical protein